MRKSHLIGVLAAICFIVPMVVGDPVEDPSHLRPLIIGDLPEGLEHANDGSFAGSAAALVSANNVRQPEDLQGGGFDLPTGGRPSPLFGAQPFTQQMLRFEEFGCETLVPATVPNAPCPAPGDAQSCCDGPTTDAFLNQPLDPFPTRTCDETLQNTWKPQIEQFLGRTCPSMPMDGRPGGEGWAHQRWDEFPPQVCFQTSLTGARDNGGLRDAKQTHGGATGEFGPDGLYHNSTGLEGFEGTCKGIPIKFHPAMPKQLPSALWTFDGTLPPKLLKARYGESIVMRLHNGLPIDPAANRGFGLHTISVHEHNGHNPAESDGYANAFFFPGQCYDYRWPMILAGHDTINTDASDPRAGRPDGNGGIINVPGDWRETMSTHWFHDHMLDYTAQNVYKGNAAMMNYYSSLDRGNETLQDEVNLRFPSGSDLDWGNRDYDVNLVVADKAWDEEGQLWFNPFNADGFMGDQLLTNWLYNPYMEVRARRYRFRILNGSVSRYFKIALVDQNGTPVPFHMIANDGNVMEHSVAFDGTLGTQAGILPTQSIAERYDIVVDFSNFQEGDRLYFVNLLEHKGGRRPEGAIPLQEVLSGAYRAVNDGDRWTDGDPCVGKFLEFRVRAYDDVDPSMNPADYVRGKKTMIPLRQPTAEEIENAIHRTFTFGRSSGTDGAPWTIKTDGGQGFSMDPRRLTAAPTLGQLEIWHIKNGGGGWSHPVHIHFEEGIILSRGGKAPPEWETWARKDVYRVGRMPDSTDSVEVAIRFREFAGTYMEHCHNTQHEDHAMLMRWDIENPGQVMLMPTPLPTFEGVEFVDTVALPTFRTGDGRGPSVLGFSGVGARNLGSGDSNSVSSNATPEPQSATFNLAGGGEFGPAGTSSAAGAPLTATVNGVSLSLVGQKRATSESLLPDSCEPGRVRISDLGAGVDGGYRNQCDSRPGDGDEFLDLRFSTPIATDSVRLTLERYAILQDGMELYLDDMTTPAFDEASLEAAMNGSQGNSRKTLRLSDLAAPGATFSRLCVRVVDDRPNGKGRSAFATSRIEVQAASLQGE